MRKNWKITFFLIILALFLGASLMYFVMLKFPMEEEIETQKEIIVIDTGISEAVSKLYDAVVVVEVYNNAGKVISTGSGFIYKKEGSVAYILTNNHVVTNGNRFYVTFSNGSKEEVKLIGKDAYSDTAILSIDSSKVLLVAKVGESSSTKIGDTVFAIGTPMSNKYSGTVTRGIISGKDRLVEVKNTRGDNFVMRVLQTDAAINSGNSGGPLANSNGEVIGMTSAKLLSNEAEGIGFAIPIEDVLKYVDKMEKQEEIIRPELGLVLLETSDVENLRNLEIYDLSNIEGLIIVDILDDSIILDKLTINDIITEIDEKKVTTIPEFKYYLYQHEIGDNIKITYIRNNKENIVDITLK